MSTSGLKRHIGALLHGTFVAMAIAAGTATALAQDNVPEMNLNVSDIGPPGSVGAAALQAFMDSVTEASGGRITFTYFPGGALLSPGENAAGIGSGTADMGAVLTPYNPADFPVSNWVAQLSSVPKGGVPYSTLTGSAAQTEFVLTNEDYIAEMEGRGLQVLGAIFGQAFDMLCNKPVRNLEEARGIRIRVGGQVWANEAQAIGMTPVPLVPTEIYEGFSRGIVDCLSIHPNAYLDFSLLDVQGDKYYVPVEFSGWNTNALSITKARWDGFSDEVKEMFYDAVPAYVSAFLVANVDRHATFAELTAGPSVELINPEQDLIDAIEAHQRQVIANLPETAPESVDSPEQLVEDFLATVEKWEGIVQDLGYAPAPEDIDDRMASYSEPFDISPFTERLGEEIDRITDN